MTDDPTGEISLKVIQTPSRKRNSTFIAAEVRDRSDFANAGRCNCRRSECRKKYCECFNAGVECTVLCKCVDCLNDGRFQHLSGEDPAQSRVNEWILPHGWIPKGPARGSESILMFVPSSGKSHRHGRHREPMPPSPANQSMSAFKRCQPCYNGPNGHQHVPATECGCPSCVALSQISTVPEHLVAESAFNMPRYYAPPLQCRSYDPYFYSEFDTQ